MLTSFGHLKKNGMVPDIRHNQGKAGLRHLCLRYLHDTRERGDSPKRWFSLKLELVRARMSTGAEAPPSPRKKHGRRVPVRRLTFRSSLRKPSAQRTKTLPPNAHRWLPSYHGRQSPAPTSPNLVGCKIGQRAGSPSLGHRQQRPRSRPRSDCVLPNISFSPYRMQAGPICGRVRLPRGPQFG